MSKGAREECVDVWSVCVCVSVGQLGLAGVMGTGGAGSLRWGAPAITTGTPWPMRLWLRAQSTLKKGAAEARSKATPPPKLASDTNLDLCREMLASHNPCGPTTVSQQ